MTAFFMKVTTTLRNDDKVNQIVPIMQEPAMSLRLQGRICYVKTYLFGLLLAGICPIRQVEMEGLEPYAPNVPISDSWL